MKKRKLWVSVLAGIMAGIMLLSLLLSLLPTKAYAQSSSEIKIQINALENQRDELQAQMDELEAKQNDNLSDIQEILEQKNLIDQQIGILQAQIRNINDQIHIRLHRVGRLLRHLIPKERKVKLQRPVIGIGNVALQKKKGAG